MEDSKTKKPSKGWKIALAVLGVLALAALAGYLYLDSLADEGDSGHLSDSYYTAEELKGDVVNILVCGLDYDAEDEQRDYGDKSLAMTDVIVYATLDVKNGTLSMLQIPRDLYVGEEVETGGTRKINAVFRNSRTDSRIDALAGVLHDQMGLTVDYYLTVDMQAVRAMVDIFKNSVGGLEMTVPWDIEDAETDFVLKAGTYKLDGETAEFILRNRNYNTADIQRLTTQRYFYLALYKALVSMPVSDMVKVLPIYSYYVDTNMSIATLASIGSKVMGMEETSIYLCTVPGGQESIHGTFSAKVDILAEILNDHFRPYSDPIAAENLKIQELPFSYGYSSDRGSYISEVSASAEKVKQSLEEGQTD